MPHRTADLCDAAEAGGPPVQVCHTPLRAFGGRRAVAGTLACLRVFEDAALLRRRLAQPGHGRVLAVDGGGSLRVALLGDRMATLALDNGWAGLLIHGAVRDVDALASMPLAVFALGAVPMRGGRAGDGEEDVPLAFGGARFVPGHFVCADADGVVVWSLASVPP